MTVRSTYPDVAIQNIDIYSFLFHRKTRPYPAHKVIYEDSENASRKYTHADAANLSRRFGQALQSKFNIRKDDVIALFTPNDIDYPVVAFAALWAGAIVSPANPGYTVSELTYQLKDCGARLVIAHWSAIGAVRKACAEIGIPQDRILILGAQHDPSGNIKHWTSTIADQSRTNGSRPKISPKSDLAFLAYSSGTTGRPKGVMLTHRNIVSNVLQISACEAGKLSHDGSRKLSGIPDAPPSGDKVLACLPYFHIYGLTALVLAPMFNGIHTIVLAKFSIENFCEIIQKEKITFIYIVPPMALLLAKHSCVSQFDLSSIRMTNSGAAPLTRELQEAVFKRCGIKIKQGYGLSETSPTTHEQTWEEWDKKIGTIGRLQPNMQAKFIEVGAEEGDDGKPLKELKAGEVGELYMKGPNVFKGYWKNERATKECLSSDGWFRTGDVGYVDKDGDFYITDRVKELIKYKGFQVPPAELEGYLVNHELVDDVAVVGVESTELGTEIPRAYIMRKGGLDAVNAGDEKRIIDWMNAKVANHKKLRGGVKFVDNIPKSASGKILRRLLKDQARKEYAENEKLQVKAKLLEYIKDLSSN